MTNPNSGATKPSNTPDFEGFAPTQTSGTQQVGGWNDVIVEVNQGLPAAARVQLQEVNGISRFGSPQQYRVRLSNGATVQLVPATADALNRVVAAVAPNVFAYSYFSRNTHVATVDANGLVTAVGRGEAEITIQSVSQVNASFPGAAPSGTAGVQAFLNVIVTV